VATRKSSFFFISTLLLICVVALPTQVRSQCNVISTYQFPFSPPILVSKILDASGSCALVPPANAASCFPGALPATVATLIAVASPTTMNPYCNWVCNCGPGYTSVPFRIDGSDGLPVELMDFSVE
jgi:hypothetical protein